MNDSSPGSRGIRRRAPASPFFFPGAGPMNDLIPPLYLPLLPHKFFPPLRQGDNFRSPAPFCCLLAVSTTLPPPGLGTKPKCLSFPPQCFSAREDKACWWKVSCSSPLFARWHGSGNMLDRIFCFFFPERWSFALPHLPRVSGFEEPPFLFLGRLCSFLSDLVPPLSFFPRTGQLPTFFKLPLFFLSACAGRGERAAGREPSTPLFTSFLPPSAGKRLVCAPPQLSHRASVTFVQLSLSYFFFCPFFWRTQAPGWLILGRRSHSDGSRFPLDIRLT